MGRILIVEDNDSVRKFLSTAALKVKHTTVDTADTVSAAVWKFTENHYDVLITDIKMPDVSGHFLIKHVKKYFPHCKIIAVSGDGKALSDAKELGASVCMTKPFAVSELIENLQEIEGSSREEEYVQR